MARMLVSPENYQRMCPCAANPQGSHFYRLGPGHAPNLAPFLTSNLAPPLQEGTKSPLCGWGDRAQRGTSLAYTAPD